MYKNLFFHLKYQLSVPFLRTIDDDLHMSNYSDILTCVKLPVPDPSAEYI